MMTGSPKKVWVSLVVTVAALAATAGVTPAAEAATGALHVVDCGKVTELAPPAQFVEAVLLG